MEPAFSIKGDTAILKDIKVNIEMMTDNSMTIESFFNKGTEFPVHNEGALRYNIYISYKDSLFSLSETDNLHGKLKGEPANEIIIQQKDGSIISIYSHFKDKNMPEGTILQPAKDFFAGETPENINKKKEKFITLYKTS